MRGGDLILTKNRAHEIGHIRLIRLICPMDYAFGTSSLPKIAGFVLKKPANWDKETPACEDAGVEFNQAQEIS